MKTMLSILVALSGLSLSACQDIKVNDSDIPIVRESQMREAIADGKTVIVDARKPEAYAKGHLPGAINIYLPQIRADDSRLAAAKKIIVYASDYTDALGIAAAKRLVAVGYVNVYEYKGGTEEWTKSGNELVNTLPEAPVRPDTGK